MFLVKPCITEAYNWLMEILSCDETIYIYFLAKVAFFTIKEFLPAKKAIFGARAGTSVKEAEELVRLGVANYRISRNQRI